MILQEDVTIKLKKKKENLIISRNKKNIINIKNKKNPGDEHVINSYCGIVHEVAVEVVVSSVS